MRGRILVERLDSLVAEAEKQSGQQVGGMAIRSNCAQQLIWIVILVASLLASLSLSFLPLGDARPPSDQSPVAGMLEIHKSNGTLHYYSAQLGLLRSIEDQAPRTLVSHQILDRPGWLLVQLAAVGLAAAFFVVQGPGSSGIWSRLNFTYAYLAVIWVNLATFMIRLAAHSMNDVPAGFERIGPDPTPSLMSGSMLQIGAGLGVAILLTYLFLRWAWARRPEQFFL